MWCRLFKALTERAAGDRPREDDAVRVHAEADEAGHRDAAVLQLGVAQPADRALGAEVEEVEVGEAERVPEAESRDTRALLEGRKVLDGLHDRRRRAGSGRARHGDGREGHGLGRERKHSESSG